MTPILYRWPGVPGKRQLAPDIFVSFAPDRPRSSFDLDVEGHFPPFVLEVVSPWSIERDQVAKRNAYERLKAHEYVLFTPAANRPSKLEGYRRGKEGTLAPWPADEQGRLWSDVLGLFLVAQEEIVRAAGPDGVLIPTLRESELAWERETTAREREVAAREQESTARQAAEEARQVAEAARDQEAEARRATEAENERLRREIDELRSRTRS